MKKVIFPFKIGVNNNAGYSIGSRLSRRTKSSMILLNSFKLDASDDIDMKEYQNALKINWVKASHEVMKMNHYYLENFAKITDHFHVKYEYRFTHSKINDEINNITENEEVIAVVITIPKDPTELIMFKEMSFDIIDNKSAPILFVPEDTQLKSINNIVFATNFNKLKNAKKYFDVAMWISNLFKANIHFVHISNDINPNEIKNEDISKRIEKIISVNSDYKFKKLYGKEVLNVLRDYVNNNNIDMIYTLGKGRGALEKLVGIEKGDSIFLKSNVPVWVEHE
jgi:hypothetical protein